MERDMDATIDLRAAAVRVQDVLMRNPAAAFDPDSPSEARQSRRFTTGITAEAPGGTTVSQQVTVELGRVEVEDGSLKIPIHWQASGHHRLLPEFEGTLTAAGSRTGTQLTLTGRYQPPLGAVGKFGDRLVGHRVARRSIERFVQQIGERVQAEVDRQKESVSWHPAPTGAEDLRETAHPSIYLG